MANTHTVMIIEMTKCEDTRQAREYTRWCDKMNKCEASEQK